MTLDLTQCDREPIHIPGAIQPHGVLLAVDPAFTVRHASENVDLLVGRPVDTVLDRPLGTLLPPEDAEVVEALLERSKTSGLRSRATIRSPRDGRVWHASGHWAAEHGILELEPANESGSHRPVTRFLESLNAIYRLLKGAQSTAHFAQIVCDELRKVSGLDRVMLYRFDAEWNGEVIGESRVESLEPFLGLHYPASDIPAQARSLYERNLLRFVPFTGYVPVRLVASASARLPLDLSDAELRSVSPVHLEYLGNMGVSGTLVMSVIVDGRLWGLIACHHHAPVRLDAHLREQLGQLGRLVSLLLDAFLRQARLERQDELYVRRENILLSMRADRTTLPVVVHEYGSFLAGCAEADGVLHLADDGSVAAWGEVPPHAVLVRIVERLRIDEKAQRALHRRGPLYVVNSLGREMGAQCASGNAAGMLALALDPDLRAMLLWFRRPVTRTVRWAGDPRKAVVVEPDGVRLSPRKSFAAWLERMEGEARPWDELEIESARRMERIADLERAAVANEARYLFEAAVHHAGEAILITDSQLDAPGPRIVYANPAFERMTGYAMDELLGQAPRILQGPETDRRVLDRLRADLAAGRVFEGETYNYRKNGERFWLHWKTAPIRNASGRITHFVAIQRDATRAREEAQRMRETNALLDAEVAERTRGLTAAVAELDAFAYTVSHDLRAPLHQLLGWSELLDERLGDVPSDEPRRLAGKLRTSAAHLSALLDALLDFSRTSRQPLEPIEVDSQAVVATVLEGLAPPAGVRVRTGPLPRVRGDPLLVRQVWHNLLSNAIKYSSRQERPEIEAGYADGAFFVRDNGSGFDMARADRLFRVFSRLHDAREYPGTGAGLAIVARIVQRHGGRIWAEAAEGRGATFRFTLPLAEAGDGPATMPA